MSRLILIAGIMFFFSNVQASLELSKKHNAISEKLRRDDPEKALSEAIKAGNFSRHSNQREYARALCNAAYARRLLDRVDDAYRDVRQCIKIFMTLYMDDEIIDAFYLESKILADKKLYLSAVERMSVVLEKYGNNHPQSAKAYGLKGIYFYYQNRFLESIQYFKKSLALVRESEQNTIEAILLNNLGVIYKKQNKFDLAKSYFRDSIKLRENKKQHLKPLLHLFEISLLENNFNSAKLNHFELKKIIFSDTEEKDVQRFKFLENKLFFENGKIIRAKQNIEQMLLDWSDALALEFKLEVLGLYSQIQKALDETESVFSTYKNLLDLSSQGYKQQQAQAEMDVKLKNDNAYEYYQYKKDRATHQFDKWLYYGLLCTIILATSNIILLIYRKRSESILNRCIQNKLKQLDSLSKTDALTGLSNKKMAKEFIYSESSKLKSNNEYVTLVFADIDNFRIINDTYGHQCGDTVIVNLAEKLKNTIRSQDFLARWGGEEYFLFLPDTDVQGAKVLCEKLRLNVESELIALGKQHIRATLTFSIAQFDFGESLESVLKRVESALFTAKQRGGNQVVIA